MAPSFNDFSYRRGPLPFCIPSLNEQDKPFQEWDGTTINVVREPCDSDQCTVYGPGSLHCIKASLEQVVSLFWGLRTVTVNFDVSCAFSATAPFVGTFTSPSLSRDDFFASGWLGVRTYAEEDSSNPGTYLIKSYDNPNRAVCDGQILAYRGLMPASGVNADLGTSLLSLHPSASDPYPSTTLTRGSWWNLRYGSTYAQDGDYDYSDSASGSASGGTSYNLSGAISIGGSAASSINAGASSPRVFAVLQVLNPQSNEIEYWIRPPFGFSFRGSILASAYIRSEDGISSNRDVEATLRYHAPTFTAEEGLYGPGEATLVDLTVKITFPDQSVASGTTKAVKVVGNSNNTYGPSPPGASASASFTFDNLNMIVQDSISFT